MAKDKKKETRTIIFIWIGVFVVAAAAIILAKVGINSANRTVVNVNTLDAAALGEAEINYTLQEFDSSLTSQQLYDAVGVNIIPAGLPDTFTIAGGGTYTPLDENGAENPDRAAYAVKFVYTEDDSVYFHTMISKTETLYINNPLAAYNLGLGDDSQNWSRIAGQKFKIFHITYGSMDSGEYYAIFIRDGHFWRIEMNNIELSDIQDLLGLYFAS